MTGERNVSELARVIRDTFGMGILDARKAIRIADERAGGDVLVGAGYIHASGLAIHVRHDRDGWNLRKGHEMAEGWRTAPWCRPLLDYLEAERNGTPRHHSDPLEANSTYLLWEMPATAWSGHVPGEDTIRILHSFDTGIWGGSSYGNGQSVRRLEEADIDALRAEHDLDRFVARYGPSAPGP